jgi:hypothetical protein
MTRATKFFREYFRKNKAPALWRYGVNLWSFVLFTLIIVDFVHNNRFQDIVGPVAAIYTATLAIYSTEKEFERWREFYDGRHPGEIYVFLWTIIIAGILFTDFALGKPYRMPSEIISTYIVVLGILAITKKSKSLHHTKRPTRPHLPFN